MDIDFRNFNTLWSSICMETLVRLGLRQVVVCPGSRSTPLTCAAASHPQIEAIPVLDERSAAFFALGLARQSGQAIALICTSGTAGANFYPAVIEAHISRVPLLILTADRPPELRDCNAGQAIDQQKLYGTYVNWYAEMAIPDGTTAQLAYARQTMVAAWERSHFPIPGPVHLNCPFRAPLAPIAQPTLQAIFQPSSPEAKHTALETIASTFDAERFFAAIRPSRFTSVSTQLDAAPSTLAHSSGMTSAQSFGTPWLHPLLKEWRESDRGLIIVGPVQPHRAEAYCQIVAQLSRYLGYPVLAEGLSPLRNFGHLNSSLISTYDALLRHPHQAQALAPEVVIRLGDMPTSKILRQWLAAVDPRQWVIDPSDRNLDPTHGRTQFVRCSIEHLGEALIHYASASGNQSHQTPEDLGPLPTLPTSPSSPSVFAKEWSVAEQVMRDRIDHTFEHLDELIEAKISWFLARHLPEGTPVFISNSMPVRDVEWFWGVSDRHLHPYFNRGANGIDGIVSTALGVAHDNQPTVLLTGDLALLHDTNGLLQRRMLKGHLTIVLVNNSGGGIFEMLPIAQFDPPFERFFATPQDVDFQQLCVPYGVEYQSIQSWEQLAQCLYTLPTEGIRVLELKCDRKRDMQWRRTFFHDCETRPVAR